MVTMTQKVKRMNSNRASAEGGNLLGIRGQLLFGFFMVIMILCLSVTFLIYKLNTIESFSHHTIEIDFPTHDATYDLANNLYISQALVQNQLISENQKSKLALNNSIAIIDNLQSSIDHLANSWNNEDNLSAWIKIKNLISQYTASLKSVQNALDADNSAQAKTIYTNELLPKLNSILDLLDGPSDDVGVRTGGLFDKQYNIVHNGSQLILYDISYIRMIIYSLLAICTISSILIALLTARKILRPLNNAINIATEIASGKRDIDIIVRTNDETGQLLSALSDMQKSIKTNEDKLRDNENKTRELFDKIIKTANAFSSHSSKVSSGDLTQRIEVESGNQMTQLGHDLNHMTENLSSIAKQITEACHGMVSALEEVRHSVDVQNTGATEQASSINEITASLEEIEKSSLQTIEKAKSLGEVAERTREKGQQGLAAVEESIGGMKSVREKVQTIAQTILDLSNQTQQVGEITAVVNSLAQQSKMLALNASIEAAKAGDAGKGFAVVASEVKNLAEQSEQSTSQVQKILEDIRQATEKAVMATEEGTKGVDLGTGLVEQTGDVVRNLSDVIYETTTATQQIEAAIRQENVGIEQITAGMNEINQVTTAFVENVKQTTEAINNIANIANSLKEYVDTYKI
ncbi:MAG: methyl-accepting chemotaxis protein [Gammaproteobacteria bacterium]|nr:methyl-accepting chemotaxis protein [Gammaproteobacteria bacterium]